MALGVCQECFEGILKRINVFNITDDIGIFRSSVDRFPTEIIHILKMLSFLPYLIHPSSKEHLLHNRKKSALSPDKLTPH